MLVWFVIGLLAWVVLRFLVRGFYTVGPNERAVITTFGRAQRIGTATTLDDSVAQSLSPDEADRYVYPQVRVIGPGVHRKWPWQSVHRMSIATVIVSIAHDPDEPEANRGGTVLDAVTKDQLNTGFTGQLRYTVEAPRPYADTRGIGDPP